MRTLLFSYFVQATDHNLSKVVLSIVVYVVGPWGRKAQGRSFGVPNIICLQGYARSPIWWVAYVRRSWDGEGTLHLHGIAVGGRQEGRKAAECVRLAKAPQVQLAASRPWRIVQHSVHARMQRVASHTMQRA